MCLVQQDIVSLSINIYKNQRNLKTFFKAESKGINQSATITEAEYKKNLRKYSRLLYCYSKCKGELKASETKCSMSVNSAKQIT